MTNYPISKESSETQELTSLWGVKMASEAVGFASEKIVLQKREMRWPDE